MPSQRIMDRLESGERLLMDGGNGSELEHRGADVRWGDDKDLADIWPWSATANLNFPEVVEQVHADYLRVGADIILSNSFWTNRIRMEPVGLGDRWEEYARAAIKLAVKARDAGNPEAYVAGSVATPSVSGFPRGTDKPKVSDVEALGEAGLHKHFADVAKVLAEEGVDFMLPEWVGYVDDCVVAVDACASVGLPVFLGVRGISTDRGKLNTGESIEDLAAALKGHKVDAILLMCSLPDATTAGLPVLRQVFDGPVGVYPNAGYWFRETEYAPKRLAEYAANWAEMGAQIIGGCCGSGPEHIKAMRPVVKGD